MQDLKKHKLAYSLLTILAVVYLAAAYYLRHRTELLFYVSLVFGFSYIIWGVIHHAITKTLSPRVMLEYILVTALGLSIISTLLL